MPLKEQKRRAALSLGIVILSAIVLIVPLVVVAVAQQPPAIMFLNPSDYNGDASNGPIVVSDRTTGNDEPQSENETTYRINSWVNNPPAQPLVEFELQIAADLTDTIGTAEQVGSNTFAFDWDIPADLLDGEYTMRAILYDGIAGGPATEVARADEDVLILNGNPQANTKGPAVDITYPTNVGPAGFYTNPISGNTNILVEYEFSGGTSFVRVFYTLSDPGDVPVWKTCVTTGVGTQTGAAGARRVRCDLDSVDQGGQSVTGIAAVANNASRDAGYNANFDQAGDAVHVLPYAQDAQSLSIVDPTVRVNEADGAFDCSPTQAVVVGDQQGRPISQIGVDVHAVGPSDQLKFHGGGILFAPDFGNQAPDSNHSGIEQSYDRCFAPSEGLPDQQGDHNRVAAPDIKHVETAATRNEGDWGVSLHTDRRGETQMTFWVDEDEDDIYCSQEPAVAGSIGWDQPAPAPTLEAAEKDVCPIPVPPPPGTSSTSPGTTTTGPTGTTTSPPDNPRGCTVQGTDDSETIEGTEGDDVICGEGGDDTIRGFGGDDTIYGDAGDDRITAGGGDDTVNGGGGDDALRGNDGNDVMFGDGGSDVLTGGADNDTLRGLGGVDTLRGGGGRDVLQGGGGNDVLIGGGGNDTLRGGNRRDVLRGGGGRDTLGGGRGNDELTGGGGNDRLNGGGGRDRCRGGRGRDRFRSCERRRR